MILRRREPACREVVELVTDYLEGGLSWRGRRRIHRHLAGCPHCSEYVAQMRTTIRLTGRLRSEDLSPHMREALLGEFRAWRAQSR